MEALVAFDAVHAGEALGDLAMAGRQDVDAEEARLADRVVGARPILLTQIRICGGSAETEQTAVAVSPPRRSRWRVVIRVTLAARWRMPFLKAAASILMARL